MRTGAVQVQKRAEQAELMERTGRDTEAGAGPGTEGVTGTAPLGSVAYSAADEEKRRGVRRMKTTATGLLLLVALIFVLATWASHTGAGSWAGYVAAAAEAGMVGALADWFAVTALFRRPLGLPIPHTAIIPNKKDQLGSHLVPLLGKIFCRNLSYGPDCGPWASADGSDPGSPSPNTPIG